MTNICLYDIMYLHGLFIEIPQWGCGSTIKMIQSSVMPSSATLCEQVLENWRERAELAFYLNLEDPIDPLTALMQKEEQEGRKD